MTDEAVNTPNTMSLVSIERRRRTLVRVVDDDPTVRRALTVFLTMDEWPVAAYPSAQTFLAEDDLSVPGCLVLDIRMPGMSGIELHREMIRRGIDLPVIFLSAHGDVEMAVEAIERGAMTFLVKPPQPEKLLETVAKAVAGNLTKRRAAEDEKRLLELWHGLTAAERRVAEQWTARINEAWDTLRDPVRRASWFCAQNGAPVNAETDTAMPPEFLMRQIEWREALEAGGADAEAALSEARAMRDRALGQLADAIDVRRDFQAARDLTRELMFVERFLAQTK